MAAPLEEPWLVLVHQLPSEPTRLRVRTWRRLQAVGAVAIKNSVYVLPNGPETREDFEWIRGEIVSLGGEAMVFSARALDQVSSIEIRAAVDRARRTDWEELEERCAELLAENSGRGSLDDDARGDLRRRAKALRARAAQIERIDHLGSPGRGEVLAALERIERLADPRPAALAAGSSPRRREDYRGRVWLTRPRPGIDRMASAWLIRRFIDPDARFRFAERLPEGGEVVPFDMFGVELGHQGERVTFETLLHEFGLEDPALTRIARIVHDLDLRSDAPGDPETATVERLVEGLRASYAEDERLLEHAIALFDAFHASYAGKTAAP